MYELEFTKNPAPNEIEALTNGISENAMEVKGIALQVQPFGFFYKNAQGVILAGCHGEICYQSMYISQLWVSKSSAIPARINPRGNRDFDRVNFLKNFSGRLERKIYPTGSMIKRYNDIHDINDIIANKTIILIIKSFYR